MGTRLGWVVLGALIGAAAMFGTATDAQMPSKRAFNGAVKPIGPYSPGVGAGGTVYLSGQIGLDPVSGQIVEGGTEAQAKRVMDNLGAVLKEAGLSYGDVVKTTIYMTDLAEFAKVNDLYATYFPAGGVPPARSTVQVARLPKDVRVEIDVIAVL